jgi:hypothetical protein
MRRGEVRASSAPRKPAKAPAAWQLHRSRLQQAPGLGLPADVVTATMIHMRDRGVTTSAIATVFKTTRRAVRRVLERHQQRPASASKPVPAKG